jgi:hypothetical protein
MFEKYQVALVTPRKFPLYCLAVLSYLASMVGSDALRTGVPSEKVRQDKQRRERAADPNAR